MSHMNANGNEKMQPKTIRFKSCEIKAIENMAARLDRDFSWIVRMSVAQLVKGERKRQKETS